MNFVRYAHPPSNKTIPPSRTAGAESHNLGLAWPQRVGRRHYDATRTLKRHRTTKDLSFFCQYTRLESADPPAYVIPTDQTTDLKRSLHDP